MNYRFINTEYLDSVADGDSSIVKELVELFREQVREFNSEMKSLLDRKDYHPLGMLAHKAKSSVAIMGMAGLANMLKDFELQAKEGRETEKFESYIKRFFDETRVAVTELDDYLSNL